MAKKVIIVGSGNAALTAGIAALEKGAKVLLLEKGNKDLAGGNTKYTAGAMRFSYNNGEELLYFGSADWMTRNLDRRIEVLTPLYDEDLAQELNDILNIQLSDNVKARIQDAQESNTFVTPKVGESLVRSQYAIYNYLKEKHSND